MALSRARKLCWRRKRVGGRVRKAASHQARKGKYAFNFKLSSRAPHCLSPPANRGRENSNILGCVCVCVCPCLSELFVRFTHVPGQSIPEGFCPAEAVLRDVHLCYCWGMRRCPVIKLFQKYWIYQNFNYLFTAEFLD